MFVMPPYYEVEENVNFEGVNGDIYYIYKLHWVTMPLEDLITFASFGKVAYKNNNKIALFVPHDVKVQYYR